MVGAIIYTYVEIMNFYIVYKNVFGIKFAKSKKHYMVMLILCAVAQSLAYGMASFNQQIEKVAVRDLAALILGVIFLFLLAVPPRRKMIFLYPVVTMLSSTVNMIGSYIIANILAVSHQEIYLCMELTILSELAGIIVFGMWGSVKKRRVAEEITFTIRQYLVLLSGLISFGFQIIYTQMLLAEGTILHKYRNELAMGSALAALLFICLSIGQHLSQRKAYRYKMENEKYEFVLLKQEEDIRRCIKEDERRRKLKHDMGAHLLALYTLADAGELDSLKEYIRNMNESLGKELSRSYTNISAVDAIIAEWHEKALQNETEWTWEGTNIGLGKVSVFDLCVILTNLLSNAVEAVEKIKGERKIDVKIKNIQDKLIIMVRNTYIGGYEGRNRPKTIKKDTVFHGLGLKNVEGIVRKQQGNIEYEITNQEFQVTVII